MNKTKLKVYLKLPSGYQKPHLQVVMPSGERIDFFGLSALDSKSKKIIKERINGSHGLPKESIIF